MCSRASHAAGMEMGWIQDPPALPMEGLSRQKMGSRGVCWTPGTAKAIPWSQHKDLFCPPTSSFPSGQHTEIVGNVFSSRACQREEFANHILKGWRVFPPLSHRQRGGIFPFLLGIGPVHFQNCKSFVSWFWVWFFFVLCWSRAGSYLALSTTQAATPLPPFPPLFVLFSLCYPFNLI